MTRPTISPSTAILINTNIMLGTGVFINTSKLAHMTGALSPLVYALTGLLLYPLIHVFIRMQSYLPRGNLYDFGALIHPICGFLSAWGYYVGKLASAYLGIHVFAHILHDMAPAIPMAPTEVALIIIATWLYQQRVEFTTSVQYTFMACKLMPLLFTMCLGLWWLAGTTSFDITLPTTWQSVSASIPFILFSFAGFEASCALSQALPFPERDAPRVILISYAIAVSISALYQGSSWIILGHQLADASSYLAAFTHMLQTVFPAGYAHWYKAIATSAIATSALGASYSIIFSNTWNLYTLAEKEQIWFSHILISHNRHGMPFICNFATAAVLVSYLLWSHGDTTPLQQMGAAGATCAYTISSLAWFLYGAHQRFMSMLALGSCGIFVYAAIQSGITLGMDTYLLFISIVAGGIAMYLTTTTSKV